MQWLVRGMGLLSFIASISWRHCQTLRTVGGGTVSVTVSPTRSTASPVTLCSFFCRHPAIAEAEWILAGSPTRVSGHSGRES